MVFVHIDRALPERLALRNANRYLIEGSIFADLDLKGLSVQVGEERFAAAEMHLLRPDVCRAHVASDPALRSLFSGFSVPIALGPVTERQQRAVTLEARFAGGQTYQKRLGTILLEPHEPPPVVLLPKSIDTADLVVICMATYNPDEALFRRQVQSILAQDHANWICLVADDASHADCRRMIRRLLSVDARFRLFEHETNVGFYHNFERCLEYVPPAARFVALADQDDQWYPHKLSTCLARLTGDTQLVYSDMRIVGADGTEQAPTFWTHRTNHYRREDLDLLALANTVTGAASVFRAELLQRALPFPPRHGDVYHDKWLALMAVLAGGIDYIDQPLYDYIQHDDNALGHKAPTASGLRAALGEVAHYAGWTSLCGSGSFTQRLRERMRRLIALGRIVYQFQHTIGKPIATQIEAALLRHPDAACRRRLRRPLSLRGLLGIHGKVRRRKLSIDNLDVKLLLSQLANRAARRLRTPLRWLAQYGYRRRWFHDRQAFPTTDGPVGAKPLADPDIVEFKRKYSGRTFVVEPRPACINLLISEVSPANFLGGYLGMFNFGRRLSELGHPVRILLTDQPALVPADLQKIRQHDQRLKEFLTAAPFEICYNEQTPVRISPEDIFVATSWWTAHLAQAAARHTCYRKFIFLEQEFEPIFYPNGSYRVLAQDAYRLDFFPFFSTEVLQQHCLKTGVIAPHNAGEFFNNPVLKFDLDPHRPRPGKKRLLFYARPQSWTMRNLYQLGCVALDRACEMGAFGKDWELHAVGGTHIGGQTLPCGATIEHLGTFDMQRYKSLLTEHDVGLSLMHSPHPSLLPMEMAAAGILTVTNTYDLKDEAYFAGISSNLRAVHPSPQQLAEALVEMAARVDDWPARVAGSHIRWPHDWDIAVPADKLQRALAAIHASHRGKPRRRAAA